MLHDFQGSETTYHVRTAFVGRAGAGVEPATNGL